MLAQTIRSISRCLPRSQLIQLPNPKHSHLVATGNALWEGCAGLRLRRTLVSSTPSWPKYLPYMPESTAASYARRFCTSHRSDTRRFCTRNVSGSQGSSSTSAASTVAASHEAATLTQQQRRALAAKLKAEELREKSINAGYYILALVIGMVGATYGSVPLYRMFCQATGYGGTIRRIKGVEEKIQEFNEQADEATQEAVKSRVLKITFNADVADGMPWKFTPTQKQVVATPGETVLAFFTAENKTDKVINGVSTYNVSPQKAGAYFNKIQCFCFEEQRLQPNEKIDMPVFFYVDPEFATDPKMRDVKTLTLSYMFFKVEEGEAPPPEIAAAQRANAAHGY